MNKILWVVGQYKGHFQTFTSSTSAWELNGIHDTEQAAIDSCKDDTFFIGPMELNVALPTTETTSWPGCYYPKQNDSN